jgi:DNA-binding MarR family transcriptional regulator
MVNPDRALASRLKGAYTRNYVHLHLFAMNPARPTPSSTAALAACACGRLRRATRALTQLYDDVLAPAGLRLTQFSLLRTLTRQGTVRITDLAAAQLLDRTALSRNLDPLVEQGLVQIVQGRDARTREVAISAKGKSALKAAEPHWARAQNAVAERIGASKLEALITTLGELEALHPSIDRHDASANASPAGKRLSQLVGSRAGTRASPAANSRKSAGTVRPARTTRNSSRRNARS